MELNNSSLGGASVHDLNLSQTLEELFMVLTPKEKDVIVQRFSLDNKPKRTLEYIGQKFSVTRERIRQIEKIALNKLRRTVQTSDLSTINTLANKVLEANGGLLLESKLVAAILNELKESDVIDSHILKLSLNINSTVRKEDKTNVYHPFWYVRDLDLALVKKIIAAGVKVLKAKGDVIEDKKLLVLVRNAMKDALENYPDAIILSSLEMDKRVKRVENGFGLMSWRHINPKSIRDKAYIVLKEERKPLHFVEISNKIIEAGFDNKVVTVQAVHNELIRYEQFVLVGRGLYALKEFGYTKGTVADIIEGLLSKSSPLTKQEIIEGVLNQRHVKKGTISLNLQKNPHFVRVGRAVYDLDLSKKPESK